MSLAPERRRRLQELGLRALLKRRFGPAVADAASATTFAGGVAVLAEADGRRLAAVFADRAEGLGSAIDLAHRSDARLYFFAETNTGATARRAAQFRGEPVVVSPAGDFEPIEPEPVEACIEAVPAALEPALRRFAAAGLEPVWEYGVLTGEWLGLEVARAVVEDGDVRVEVGVGRHDREANAMLHPDGPTDALLDHAIATVAALRLPDARPHPANQLVRERWLRSVLCAAPSTIGMADLRPVPPPEERSDLRRRGVAPAAGVDAAGAATVVVCSVGVDPDLVPQAADARLQAAVTAAHDARLGATGAAAPTRLVIVVPEDDAHPLTVRLAGLLADPAEVVTVPAGWASLPD